MENVMQFSVSISAEGDREISLPEIVEFADAVAPYQGIASGAGSMGYGAQLVVEADHSESALENALSIFAKCVTTAQLPNWQVTSAETISEIEDFEDEYIGDQKN